MEKLGIRPASEKEHEWRRALFRQDCTQSRKDEIRQTLNPFFAKMGISKPYMLVWYIASKGEQFMKELTRWSRAEMETYLWQMVWELNGEFVAHRPIR